MVSSNKIKMSDCNLCSLRKNRIQVAKPIIKSSNPVILCIGNAPDQQEDESGKLFHKESPTGKWFWKIM